MTSLLKLLVLYCALTDLAGTFNHSDQTQHPHQQLARAARELTDS